MVTVGALPGCIADHHSTVRAFLLWGSLTTDSNVISGWLGTAEQHGRVNGAEPTEVVCEFQNLEFGLGSVDAQTPTDHLNPEPRRLCGSEHDDAVNAWDVHSGGQASDVHHPLVGRVACTHFTDHAFASVLPGLAVNVATAFHAQGFLDGTCMSLASGKDNPQVAMSGMLLNRGH